MKEKIKQLKAKEQEIKDNFCECDHDQCFECGYQEGYIDAIQDAINLINQ